MQHSYLLMLAFCMGSMTSLIAVALGGFLVFRTKRESHEPLIPWGNSRDEEAPVNLDDFEHVVNEEDDPVSNIFANFERESSRFNEQRKAEGTQSSPGDKGEPTR